MDDPFQFVGTVIEQRYRVDQPIGEGGFGVVYRGYHLRLEHPVAIKCLKIPHHFTANAREIFLQRFREEGRILIKLGDAPGVPRVYDCGVIQHAVVGPVPFLVMEWLDGYSLEDMLEARRQQGYYGFAAHDAVQLLLPAVDAIAVAHESQIAHRDIKPANLYIAKGTRGSTMKVLDFGIAKAMQEGENLTQGAGSPTATNFRSFTPNYAAPEQFAPKRYGLSGPWTDVHAIGLVLYEMLTGRSPNPGEDFVECLEVATADRRPSPRSVGASVSDALEAVVQRAVSRAAEHRFPHASALASALRQTPEATGRSSGSVDLGPVEPPPRTVRGGPAMLPSQPHPGVPSVVVQATPSGAFQQSGGMYGNTSLAGIGASGYPMTNSYPSTGGYPPGQGYAPAPGHQPAYTAQPVSMTHQPSRVPPTPRPPEVRTGGKRRKSSPLPYIAGAFVLAGAVGGGVYVYGKNPAKPKPKSSASAVASVQPEEVIPAKTTYALDYVIGREVWPINPLPGEAEAKGQGVVRLFEQGGKVVKIERLNPSGLVVETIVFQVKEDGATERTVTDGRNVVLETYRTTKDGIETRKTRAGSPFMNGCARVQLKYNAAGDVTDRVCQDNEGHVIIDNNGCQLIHLDVGQNHVVTASRCQQEDGRPLTNSSGIYLRRYTLDAFQQTTEVSYFGIQEELVASSNACTRERYTYDAAHNRTSETCIGASGLPSPYAGSTNIATIVYGFDGNGCVVKESYKDTDNQITSLGTYSGRVHTRDPYCGQLSWSTVGPAGALTALQNSPARVERTYDANGDETEMRCVDQAQQPFNCAGDSQTATEGTTLRYARDQAGRVISEKAFDGIGKPSRWQAGYPHETRKKYDDKGQLIELSYFGPDGQPSPALSNVGRKSFKRDALGAETSVASYGVTGLPVVDSTGKHEIRRSYDAKHRLVAIELRDAEGNYPKTSNIRFGAVIWPNEAIRLVIARDGSRIENRYYDWSGKEVKVVDCTSLLRACER